MNEYSLKLHGTHAGKRTVGTIIGRVKSASMPTGTCSKIRAATAAGTNFGNRKKTMSNEIQFFTSILAMESTLKPQYALSITRSWDRAYITAVFDVHDFESFERDPCIIQQRNDLCLFNEPGYVEREVERFWRRLVKGNLIKSEFLQKNA